jgi:hypothetical protein
MHSSETDLLQAQASALKESANAIRNDLEEVTQQVTAAKLPLFPDANVDAARSASWGQRGSVQNASRIAISSERAIRS